MLAQSHATKSREILLKVYHVLGQVLPDFYACQPVQVVTFDVSSCQIRTLRPSSNVCMCLQSFHSRQGKAYLFNAVINVLEGPKEERLMTTGETAQST